MKNYPEDVMNILNDPKFINQKGIRSIIDKDARVGRMWLNLSAAKCVE